MLNVLNTTRVIKILKQLSICTIEDDFDVKKEDFRRKTRLVAGGHAINSSMFESYSSVVQSTSLILLQKIALNEGLDIVTTDVGNAFIQAFTNEKIWSR